MGRFAHVVLSLLTVCFVGACTEFAQAPTNVCSMSKYDRVIIERDVIIDHELDPRVQQAVSAALLEWAQRSRGAIRWNVRLDGVQPRDVGDDPTVRCSNSLIVTVASSHEGIVRAVDEMKDSEVVAFTAIKCKVNLAVLVLDRIRTLEEVRVVMAHELGHFLGLPDVKTRKAIMHGSIETIATNCLTIADAEQFCKLHGCDPKKWDVCQ